LFALRIPVRGLFRGDSTGRTGGRKTEMVVVERANLMPSSLINTVHIP
jgi:hypothetical protein